MTMRCVLAPSAPSHGKHGRRVTVGVLPGLEMIADEYGVKTITLGLDREVEQRFGRELLRGRFVAEFQHDRTSSSLSGARYRPGLPQSGVRALPLDPPGAASRTDANERGFGVCHWSGWKGRGTIESTFADRARCALSRSSRPNRLIRARSHWLRMPAPLIGDVRRLLVGARVNAPVTRRRRSARPEHSGRGEIRCKGRSE